MKKYFIALLIIALLMTSCSVVNTPPDVPDETPTEAPTEVPTEAPTEDTTEAPTDAPIDNPNNGVVGGFVPCVHNVLTETGSEIDSSYHSLSTTLIEYVGEENYNNWLEVAQKEKKAAYERGEASCPWLSIVEFVEYFDVPREILEMSNATQHPTVDHNIDIIYAGEEAAEKYYTRERYQEAALKHLIAILRADLGHDLYKNRYDEFDAWQTEKNKNGWYAAEVLTALSKKLEAEKRDLKIPTSSTELFVANQSNISFVELIKYFEIPRETVEQTYSKYENYKGFEGKLDLDALYAAEFDEEYFRTTSPIEIDMQFFTYDGK